MKLDDTVCRGSLIIHKGESYVVLGRFELSRDVKGSGWKINPTPKEGVWSIAGANWIGLQQEVDTFFPGAVFEIPDYIR
jgi:hypothetical protein